MQRRKSPSLTTDLRISVIIGRSAFTPQFLCVYDCADRGLSGFRDFRLSDVRVSARPLRKIRCQTRNYRVSGLVQSVIAIHRNAQLARIDRPVDIWLRFSPHWPRSYRPLTESLKSGFWRCSVSARS